MRIRWISSPLWLEALSNDCLKITKKIKLQFASWMNTTRDTARISWVIYVTEKDLACRWQGSISKNATVKVATAVTNTNYY